MINYNSRKSRPIVILVIGGKLYAFVDLFDAAYTIKRDLELILNVTKLLKVFTDLNRLFDIIIKCSGTTEKRLLIDFKAIRKAYEIFIVSDVGFIRVEHNTAYAFTNSVLCRILRSSKSSFEDI